MADVVVPLVSVAAVAGLVPLRHRTAHTVLTDVIAAAAQAGHIRTDVPAPELATYSLHALAAAADLPATHSARTRLVEFTLAALRPAPPG